MLWMIVRDENAANVPDLIRNGLLLCLSDMVGPFRFGDLCPSGSLLARSNSMRSSPYDTFDKTTKDDAGARSTQICFFLRGSEHWGRCLTWMRLWSIAVKSGFVASTGR